MKDFERKGLPMNLQLFAESKPEDDDDTKDGESNIPKGNEGNDNERSSGDSNGSTNNDNSGEKKFTQAEVNAMMSKEKKQGRQAILNALGIKDMKELEEFIQKTNEPTNQELAAEKKKAEDRATAAENKLACVMAGVNKDSVDDVMSIALSKVTDDKTLANVLEEMKNVPKYAGFFGTEKQEGTGSDVGHIGGEEKKESMGQRLAKQNKTVTKKSSYF